MIARAEFCVEYGFYNNFLNFILENDIPLNSVKLTEFGFTAVCRADDYKKIAFMARRFQCRIKLKKKKGIYFALYPYRNRKGIIIGAVIFPLLCFLYSCVIWTVDINTDDLRLKNTIAHSLYRQGVYPGNICSKNKLSDVQRQLMLENKNISYVTLNFYRGILECEVYSRAEKQNFKENYSTRDIVCRLSGVVTDIRVYSGFSDIKPGQSVTRGSVLVAAADVDEKNRLYFQDTAAYVAGDCEKEYKVFVPYNKKVPVYTGVQNKKISISFLGKNIPLTQGNNTENLMFTEKQTISHVNFCGFILPFTVFTNTFSYIDESEIFTSFPEARNVARNQLQHMIADDIKLEKEYSRQYDYLMSEDGITAVCIVNGRYIMI